MIDARRNLNSMIKTRLPYTDLIEIWITVIDCYHAKGSGGKKKYIPRNWRKRDPCYTVVERLGELYSKFMQKEET
jgi:hypothetical protein